MEKYLTTMLNSQRTWGGIYPAAHALPGNTIISMFHPLLVPPRALSPSRTTALLPITHQHPLPRSHPRSDINRLNDEHQRAALASVRSAKTHSLDCMRVSSPRTD